MGKNMPERKDYIMDKLAVPVDERRIYDVLRIYSARFLPRSRGCGLMTTDLRYAKT